MSDEIVFGVRRFRNEIGRRGIVHGCRLETAMLIFFLEFTKNPALRNHSEDWLLALPCRDPKR
jgi:hypothetical protein